MLLFGKKFPGEKGSVRRFVFVMQQPSSFVAKVRGGIFSNFHTAAVRCHTTMRNWLFGLPGRILCQQSPWYERKFMSMLLSLSVCLSLFGLGDFGFSAFGLCLIPERLSNHRQGLRPTFSEICTTLAAGSFWNRIRPITLLEIKGCKNQHVHRA
jgi:hypothetical protein